MKKLNYIIIFVLALSINAYAVFEDTPKRITFSNLPNNIQTFVETYFTNYKYLYAVEDSYYKVHFKGNVTAFFDIAGDWNTVSGSGEAIPTDFIDSNILKAVSAKYPDKKITKVYKTSKKYDIKLSNGTAITLDKEGNILKTKDKRY